MAQWMTTLKNEILTCGCLGKGGYAVISVYELLSLLDIAAELVSRNDDILKDRGLIIKDVIEASIEDSTTMKKGGTLQLT